MDKEQNLNNNSEMINNEEKSTNIISVENKEKTDNEITPTITSQLNKKVSEFIKIVKDKSKIIELKDFHLHQKIKTSNEISPLMLYILQMAVDKYNDINNLNINICNNNIINNNKNDSSDIGLEDVGFSEFIAITLKDKVNNRSYFNSDKAFVLYAAFSEKLIGSFWENHQLLKDLLVYDKNIEINTKLKLGRDCKTINQSASGSKDSIKAVNKEVGDVDGVERVNNKNYCDLTLGASFEYNALKFVLYGIKEYKNLPRIVFYPIVDYIDYVEIDNAFIIKEMKPNLETYFSNFRSINLFEDSTERKHFILNKNDIVFIEATYNLESKKAKITDFFNNIIRFIDLYQKNGLIDNINNYRIKPVILYNKNYNVNKNLLDKIKESVNKFKTNFNGLKELNNEKLKEIYNNLDIIYCWPTIPILNNVVSDRDNKKEIDELKKNNLDQQLKINKLEEEKDNQQNQINNQQKEIDDLKRQMEDLKRKGFNNNYNYKYKSYYNTSYNRKYNNNNFYNYNYKSKYYYKRNNINNVYNVNRRNYNKNNYKYD